MKEVIKNETTAKFDSLTFKNAKDLIPPKAQPSSSTNINSLKNSLNQVDDLLKSRDDVIPKPTKISPNTFKLEGKTNVFEKRTGSRTNRENHDSMDMKYNFNALDQRRAEHKKNRQMTHHQSSNSNVPNIQNIEDNIKQRQERVQQREAKLNIYEERKKERYLKKELDRDEIFSNISKNFASKNSKYLFEHSPDCKSPIDSKISG